MWFRPPNISRDSYSPGGNSCRNSLHHCGLRLLPACGGIAERLSDGQGGPRSHVNLPPSHGDFSQLRPMSLCDTETRLTAQLAKAREGCTSALGELLEEFRPYLKSLGGGALGSSLNGKASDSDLAQESLVQAAFGFSDFQGETVGEFRNWIARIFEHRAIDLARRYRCEKRDVAREDRNGHLRVDSAVADDLTPSGHLQQSELLAKLVNYLGGLSMEDQTLIRLRHSETMSFDEVAARLGWARETTRRRWYYLIEALGRALEPNP